MSRFKAVPYRGIAHGNFEEEWGIHRGCSDWWYATGSLVDDEGRVYSFQFTMLRLKVSVLRPYVIMLALTDFETGRHHYFQRVTLSGKDMRIDGDAVGFGDAALLQKLEGGMRFTAQTKEFSLNLMLDYGKGAVWHCDNGLLRMGIDAPRQTTIYYSYPNMPTSGTLTLNGEARAVKGKAWFDRQGGPYSIKKRECMWEWFSLRFLDDEEMMLFSFPQDDYRDGTYIRADGSSARLNAYSISPLDFVYPDGRTKYSYGWKLVVPGLKDEHYTIKPLLKGQMNMGYYELLADVFNERDEKVGACFVELLPGVYNTKFPDTVLKNTKG
jgi:predicted secreted hydrolase